MDIYQTPKEFVDQVGYLNSELFLRPSDDNEWEIRNNKNLYKNSPNPLVYLYNFIMNNIVSKIYINKNRDHLGTEVEIDHFRQWI